MVSVHGEEEADGQHLHGVGGVRQGQDSVNQSHSSSSSNSTSTNLQNSMSLSFTLRMSQKA